MLNENIINMRKAKGLSQEELSQRIHVTRQTVSKWERGLSVPDADSLICLSEVFEISVSALLGDTIESIQSNEMIAEKLEQLNLLIAEKNQRNRKLCHVLKIILIAFIIVFFVCIILNIFSSHEYANTETKLEHIEKVSNK